MESTQHRRSSWISRVTAAPSGSGRQHPSAASYQTAVMSVRGTKSYWVLAYKPTNRMDPTGHGCADARAGARTVAAGRHRRAGCTANGSADQVSKAQGR